jgi:hypothetical protein
MLNISHIACSESPSFQKPLLSKVIGSALLSLYFILSFTFSVAQQRDEKAASSEESFLEYVNDRYGADDNLVNGTVYIPHNPLIARHPFYETDEWYTGILYIRGRTYENQQVRYNLAIDRIILNATFRDGANIKIVLNSWLIDSLSIGDHFFINSLLLFPQDKDTTFYEVIYRNGFSFVSVYRKEYINKFADATPYGLWSGQNPSHFIIDDEKGRIMIASKKDLLEYFYENKDDIRRRMKTEHIRYKKASPGQLKRLLEFCGRPDPKSL